MQWTDTRNAGFSTAEPQRLLAPVISDGPYGYREVNVLAARRDPESLLTWFERMLHTRRECEEIGAGEHEVIDIGEPDVLVHRAHGEHGAILFVHNLGEHDKVVAIPPQPGECDRPLMVAADGEYPDDVDLLSLSVRGNGYLWLRLNHTPWE
jgi:maltose alpha-D-glucosyltransferase/alpha-amylase